MSEAHARSAPDPAYPSDFIGRWQALWVVRRRPSKAVARRLRLPAEQWWWPEVVNSPQAVNFRDRAWLFHRLAADERAVDYAALCRA